MMLAVALPEQLRALDLALIVAMSAGKDSTATALALLEAGYEFRMVFADTGWEEKRVYEHLEHLREKIGPIDVVGSPGGMQAKVRERAGFPGRLQRWCTNELKLRPLREYHDAHEMTFGRDTLNVVGVRSAESDARSKLSEYEDDDTWNGWIWRPIIRWTTEDVLRIHHRHGIDINPLYKLGHNRVGCYPCIMSTKEDIRLVAQHAPERIAEIRELETWCTEERVRRNAETPGRYKHARATFFQHHPDRPEIYGIDSVVTWSKTRRGGRELPLLPQTPTGGCFRWGFCEPEPELDPTYEPTPEIEPAPPSSGEIDFYGYDDEDDETAQRQGEDDHG